ncbi:MAG: recombinase family protein [Elusimicrobia bacterium]|nr:recombinase family protein [Elusimicrobiota bacterium]
MISRERAAGRPGRPRLFFRRDNDNARPEKPKAQKVACYVRVSTEEQAQSGYSIPAQIEKLEHMCKSQDWQMLPTYVDDGYSGKNLERPAIQRLLADARKRKLDLILVYKLDRFSRRLSDLVRLGEELERLGIGLRSMTEPFDTTYPAGKLLFNMLGSFAQFERELIGERTRLGLRRRLREGKWNGRPTFGYAVGKEGCLELHPTDGSAAKRIFHLFLEELLGVTLITRRMNDEDKASSRRGRWHNMSVWNMLTNPVYAGQVIIGGEIHAGHHPALITKEQFDLIQSKLKSNALTPPETLHSRNILTGIIRCGKCGSHLTTAKGKGSTYDYYACTKRVNDAGCDLPYIPARAIEACVLAALRKLAGEPEMIEKYLAEHKAQDEELLARLRLERTALQHKLDGMTRAKDAKVQWLAQTLPDKTVADEVGKEIARQLEGIGATAENLRSLDRRITEVSAETAKSEEIAEFLTRFDEGFGSLTVPQKRRMVKSLVQEVRVSSLCDAKVVFSIPFSAVPEWKTGPKQAPFVDEERHKDVPTELLASRTAGSLPNKTWLPEAYSPQKYPVSKKPFVLWDVSKCLTIRARHGRQKIVNNAAFQDHKTIRDKTVKKPAPPRIQALLRQGHELKARLAADRSLTKTAVAREARLDLPQLTRLLRLTNLSPEIQQHIQALPPSVGRIVVTERRLRPIAKLPSHRDQNQRFRELLRAPVRARKTPPTIVQLPVPPAVAPLASLGHLGA